MYKYSLLSPLPHSVFCPPAMQMAHHLLLLVWIVTIAELNLVNTNKEAEVNLVNTKNKAKLNLVTTTKKAELNLVKSKKKAKLSLVNTKKKAEFNDNPNARYSLTSKCNLNFLNKGVTNTDVRQILCQLLMNFGEKGHMKVSQKGTKKPNFVNHFPENAEKRKLNIKTKDEYSHFKIRVM